MSSPARRHAGGGLLLSQLVVGGRLAAASFRKPFHFLFGSNRAKEVGFCAVGMAPHRHSQYSAIQAKAGLRRPAVGRRVALFRHILRLHLLWLISSLIRSAAACFAVVSRSAARFAHVCISLPLLLIRESFDRCTLCCSQCGVWGSWCVCPLEVPRAFDVFIDWMDDVLAAQMRSSLKGRIRTFQKGLECVPYPIPAQSDDACCQSSQ
ncbi:hypothetical protein B0I35DRAFT_416850 [Stachybotrys elegans]|uniref:Uncharacterized protein n=1 Tax=Stachybotrys elegans TaxID=80388 RepID=A0A8K0WW20_9HYPO|nr:hypothetical protein B0I35DRAFT_416850 [Stachybotrys elegans]